MKFFELMRLELSALIRKHGRVCSKSNDLWIPACAGMTGTSNTIVIPAKAGIQ